MATYKLNINGQDRSVEVDPTTPILWVLRDHLNLVGTKFGCGIAQCGACTIHVNGTATRSCLTPVSSIGNSKISPKHKRCDRRTDSTCDGHCSATQSAESVFGLNKDFPGVQG